MATTEAEDPSAAPVKKVAAKKVAAKKVAAKKVAAKKVAAKKVAAKKVAATSGSGGRRTASAPAIHYENLSVAAFQHPADRAATSALSAVPGLDTAVRWLIEQGYERALYQQNLAASVRIGPAQLPELWDSCTEVLHALDLPGASDRPPTLYVSQDPSLNASTLGSQNPYIVLTNRLVEVLDPDEIRAVLAHEAGHILASHVVYHTALQVLLGLSLPVLNPGALPLNAIRLALLEWYRAAELTCDRAAVLAVDDPELMIRTLMVLGGGLASSRLSLSSFMQQVREYQDWEDGPDRLRRFLSLLNQTHGTPVRRASEILRWVESGEFDRIRNGDYVRRGEEAGTASAAGDAAAHYSERFRDIFSTAGDSVAKAGSRLQTWLKGD
jgi:Zn-dependent protease with chaperone function